MKFKKITSIIALTGVIACASALAACGGEEKFEYTPTDEKYAPPFGWAFPKAEPDAEITLDGIPTEDAFENQSWYRGKKIFGSEYADINFTTYFGEKGFYIAFDVSEQNAHIYYNPDRNWIINSGVEVFLATEGTTSMDSPSSLRIDLKSSGDLNILQRQNGFFIDAMTTHEINPVYKCVTKGGALNTEFCYGYSGELFVPYAYFEHLGLLGEDEKINVLYMNPVLNTAYNYEGETENDRHWYNTAAADTDGNGWSDPSKNFHFDKDGFMCYAVSVESGDGGSVSTPKNYDFAVANNSLTLDLKADDGYTIKSIKVNDVDKTGDITFADYSAKLRIDRVTQDVKVVAEFQKLPAERYTLSGEIFADGKNANRGLSDMRVKVFDGFNFIDMRVKNGAFSGKVAAGEYQAIVYSQRDGFEIFRQNITVSADTVIPSIVINDELYDGAKGE